MSKQCLDVQQMQHLKELGLDTANASMYWISYNGINISIPSNFHLPASDNDYVICNAYTLQDVLELLPTEIKMNQKRCWLRMDLSDGCIYYYYEDSNLIEQRVVLFNGGEDIDLLEAAYRILCWCIENGYVDTNKTNEV